MIALNIYAFTVLIAGWIGWTALSPRAAREFFAVASIALLWPLFIVITIWSKDT